MRDVDPAIAAGRDAFAKGEWARAFELLAPERRGLEADDLRTLARSAWFCSRVAESIDLSEAVYERYVDEKRTADAVATALLLALLWFARAEMMLASGWMSRARRLLDGAPDVSGVGYLTYLEGMIALLVDGRPAAEAIHRLRRLAEQSADPALAALERTVSGVADLRQGETARGFARLDEAMLPVMAGRLPPEWAGDIYCTVVHMCYELGDHARMDEWTRAMERWCRRFAGDAVYSGICRLHRLELLGARGDWAEVETKLALESGALADGNAWIAGEGFYQLGEIRRRRGDAVGARESYASARRVGIDPQPGEGLLLLREGRAEDAWAAVSGALHGRDRVGRVRLLRAGVEIAISTGRLAEAAELTRELRSAADDYATPGFQAWADHAVGMLALAEDRTDDALAALRSAESVFRRDRLPYETAMTLLWIHRVHARAGDDELAERSHAQAQAILARLGADDPGGQAGSEAGADAYAGSASVGPLTAREAEILAVVAVGASNRIVAERLFISEKTVGRHLANIYAKLGVGSRTAAAAWWREHASSPDA